ncbi:MAG: Rho termination factor N-terminal domain-containing protein [Bacillota bacterium]
MKRAVNSSPQKAKAEAPKKETEKPAPAPKKETSKPAPKKETPKPEPKKAEAKKAPAAKPEKAQKKAQSDDFDSKTVTELKEIAKDRGMTGYSKLRKAELIEALRK